MLQIGLILIAVLLLAAPLGTYCARVLEGKRTLLSPALFPLERLIYRALGTSPQQEMRWQHYALGLIVFHALGFALLYALLLVQGVLPLNPQNLPGVAPDLAFNIALSFLTNTNWQSYGGETTLSYLSQMAGLGVQNFLSAACGIAVAAALFRAFARRNMQTIGNVWVDVTRAVLYILLPLSLLLAVALASQGVVQTFEGTAIRVQNPGGQAADSAHTILAPSGIAQGPVASQVAIKQLGSNGGGFFNTNSAHPLENPTPLSNMLELFSILLLPVTMIYTFGVMVGDRRQGISLIASMLVLFLPLAVLAMYVETQPNPALTGLPIEWSAGNMEGKEVRFGAENSAFWAAATTATSNGSVNSMHDSFLPLAGFVPMLLMQFGEVVFGGVGSGMYGLLTYVLVTVFIGGLMVGRTPEYLGKKIQAFEIKMASISILAPCALTLIGTAIAVTSAAGYASAFNPGTHGFSEILYGVTSAANNNGSAFAGLSANTPFFNIMLGILMFSGRFLVMLPALAIAGAVAAKNTLPPSAGTLPTHTPLFCVLLMGSVMLLGILTYVPALALGPVAEHLHLMGGFVRAGAAL